MTSADTCQCIRLQTMFGNAFTGLAILEILNCTVNRVTYTKWSEEYALPDQEDEKVAQTVMDNLVCRFGCPRGVFSDQGRNFESRKFRGLCSLIDSVKQRTTPYHPQCDWGPERLIRTVSGVIAKMAEEQKEWRCELHLMKRRGSPQYTHVWKRGEATY